MHAEIGGEIASWTPVREPLGLRAMIRQGLVIWAQRVLRDCFRLKLGFPTRVPLGLPDRSTSWGRNVLKKLSSQHWRRKDHTSLPFLQPLIDLFPRIVRNETVQQEVKWCQQRGVRDLENLLHNVFASHIAAVLWLLTLILATLKESNERSLKPREALETKVSRSESRRRASRWLLTNFVLLSTYAFVVVKGHVVSRCIPHFLRQIPRSADHTSAGDHWRPRHVKHTFVYSRSLQSSIRVHTQLRAIELASREELTVGKCHSTWNAQDLTDVSEWNHTAAAETERVRLTARTINCLYTVSTSHVPKNCVWMLIVWQTIWHPVSGFLEISRFIESDKPNGLLKWGNFFLPRNNLCLFFGFSFLSFWLT